MVVSLPKQTITHMIKALKTIKDAFIADKTEVIMATATIIAMFAFIYCACYIASAIGLN